jgi:putative flippase GtrA
MKFTKSETVRFLITGGVNTLLTYLIYLALIAITDYRTAFTSSFIAGIFIAYSLNALFVFKTALSLRKMIQYPLIYAFQYGTGLLLLGILIENFGVDKRFAPLINLILLTPITFMLNKWFLLRKVA